MKILFFTIDCFKGREHLMPWRTILEVARVMVEKGHKANILNACNNQEDVIDYDWTGFDTLGSSVHVCSVIKKNSAILSKCKALQPEVLLIPFTFRDGLNPAQWIARVNCKKVGYMAGGVYDWESGIYLCKDAGLRMAKPYLLEALIPKSLFASAMHKTGVNHIIGLTDLTSEKVRQSGIQAVKTIYPGKDSFDKIIPDDSILRKYELDDKKWLLFSGAPAPTRGAEVLLKALDKVKDESVRLIMLMRTDVGSVYEKFEKTLACMKHPERVTIIKERLTREQLRAFFGTAWYGLLPFIVIPSEVPLTYFELLSCGTPVITFANGGTTKYLKEGLLISDRSVKGLAKVIDMSWQDAALRNTLSDMGKRIMASHPTWKQVGMEWIQILKQNG